MEDRIVLFRVGTMELRAVSLYLSVQSLGRDHDEADYIDRSRSFEHYIRDVKDDSAERK